MKFINQIEPSIGESEITAVNEYFRSGGWLTEYKKTEEFECMIAKFLNVKYAIAVTSGTAALYLALLALGIKEGDKVIVPDYTMIATPNAVRWTGADVILCDVERNTLCLDLNKIELTNDTKALIYVAINGRSGNMQNVVNFCRMNKIHLVEDACQGFGSNYADKSIGTFGTVGAFSFTPHKIITTGQGGIIVTNYKEVRDKVKELKDFCRISPGIDIHTGIGFNFKFTDLQAVIGIEQLKSIKKRIELKKVIYAVYKGLLYDVEFIEMLNTDLNQITPWFIDVLLKNVNRQEFILYLIKNNIGVRQFYPPIHTQEPYAEYNVKFNEVVPEVVRRGIWLPSSLTLNFDDIKYITETIKNFRKDKK